MQKFIVLAFSLCLAGSAAADTIYSTSFEQPDIVPGSIEFQDGWYEGYSTAANVVTGYATTGTQSLQINGSDLTLDPTSNTYIDYVTNQTFMSPSDYVSTAVSVNARLDGPLQTPNDPSGDLASVNLDLHSDIGDVAQMEISANGNVYTEADGIVDSFSASVTPGVYHNLGISLDIVNQSVTFTVDGTAIGTQAVDPSLGSSNFLYTDLQMVEQPDSLGFDHTSYTGRFDDFNWTANAGVVPEPSMVVLGLGLTAGVLLRRRK